MRAGCIRRGTLATALFGVSMLADPAWAGPPFLTDDPEPTERHHWEIYGPLLEGEGRGGAFDGSAGVELNYGAARDVQVTVGLPWAIGHDAAGWHGGGDIGVSVKYRVLNMPGSGIQVALFPAVTLPTARRGFGARRVTALLPVWVQKDVGPWSIFGGGGYALNPGSGNRHYWTGGAAVARSFGDRALLGIEVRLQGRDSSDGRASTSLGIGGTVTISCHLRLLASGGPTFEDKRRGAGYHGFLALGLDY